jgi:hypothetical protein
MQLPGKTPAVRLVLERLADLFNVQASKTRLRAEPRLPDGGVVDAVAQVGPHTFVIEWKRAGTAGPVAMAVEQVRRYAAILGGNTIPLVAVPYMGEVGRRRCEDAGVAWLDLSGNARIVAPGLRVLIEGKPNRFKRRGRPSSAFAPRSSRIARWLLMHPHTPVTQRELAQATGMDEGYTSRIVGKLEEEGLITRDEKGAIRPRDPGTLLDVWREEYDFSKHYVLRGHVPARSGDELLRRLAEGLRKRDVDYAATALGAAWLLTRFAGFRIVTMYLREPSSAALLDALSFREDPRGANVWLVVPNDEGVFHGASEHDGVVCVHPVQVYVDLKDHPERSDEAAARLRAELLSRRSDG